MMVHPVTSKITITPSFKMPIISLDVTFNQTFNRLKLLDKWVHAMKLSAQDSPLFG